MLYKSIQDLSNEEKLTVGTKLVERKASLIYSRTLLRKLLASENQVLSLKHHDPTVYVNELWANLGLSPKVAADSVGFTKEMSDKWSDRSQRVLGFMLSIVEEQLAEVNEVLVKL
jgi:hypothetical protein